MTETSVIMGLKRYSLDYLKEISGGDQEFILDMIQTFIKDTPAEISILKDLSNNKQWDGLYEHVHRLAPSFQFLGLISLNPIINQIEVFSFGKKNLEMIPALIDKLDIESLTIFEEIKKDFNL